MNDFDLLKSEVEDLKEWKRQLETSHSIPLNIDQAFRARFKSKGTIIAAGEFTTAGGDATESITGLGGVKTTDHVFVVLEVAGNTPRTIVTSTTVADGITVVFSGDPSTDHRVSYLVIRYD